MEKEEEMKDVWDREARGKNREALAAAFATVECDVAACGPGCRGGLALLDMQDAPG